jgi:CheY-like chemotaxis protein
MIMLVDDSATILLSISKLLARTGCAVKKASLAAGASGWLVKPATADELPNTIKRVVR